MSCFLSVQLPSFAAPFLSGQRLETRLGVRGHACHDAKRSVTYWKDTNLELAVESLYGGEHVHNSQ